MGSAAEHSTRKGSMIDDYDRKIRVMVICLFGAFLFNFIAGCAAPAKPDPCPCAHDKTTHPFKCPCFFENMPEFHP